MKKHAYLIMCHNNFEILSKLLSLLDDEMNDIFIHIDKKVKGIRSEEIVQNIQKAEVKFVKSIQVNWGGGIRKLKRN